MSAYMPKAGRDFDHCVDTETKRIKRCKDCDLVQKQRCECEVFFTENKPVSLSEARADSEYCQARDC